MNNRHLACLGVLFCTQVTFALVRGVSVDDTSMAEIHLSMGKSTVLHFSEKPTKVVVGNQNYFNIEFTGEDVTIQPLGGVVSNLFVYTEYYRYGFVLRVGGAASYDDLVQVRWRSKHLYTPPLKSVAPPPPKKKAPPAVTKSPVSLTQVFYDAGLAITVAEFEIFNETPIQARNILVTANAPIRSVVFDKDANDHANPVLRARAFLSAKPGKHLSLQVSFSGRKIKVPIIGERAQ